MKYKQKLTKIGNSLGIILPKKLLDSLDLHPGMGLYVEKIQDKIVVEKEASTSVSPEFLRIAENIGKKYKEAFKELA